MSSCDMSLELKYITAGVLLFNQGSSVPSHRTFTPDASPVFCATGLHTNYAQTQCRWTEANLRLSSVFLPSISHQMQKMQKVKEYSRVIVLLDTLV